MSVMKRMRDISVATLNEMLEGAEDPVKMIDRFLYEQREKIDTSEKLFRQAAVHGESLRQQWLNAASLREKRERQAELAMKAGEEHLARLALSEKLSYEERENQYRGLYETTRAQLAELEEQLQAMKADFQEVYSKRQYFAARMESLRLQQRMNQRIGQGGAYTGRMFDRLDERMRDLELEASSLRDVRRVTGEAVYRIGTAFTGALERELDMLRQKVDAANEAETLRKKQDKQSREV